MELGEKLKNHRIKKVCRRNVIPDAVLVSIKFVLLLSSTIWMAYNLRYEKDPEQYRKNTKIELAYGTVQLIVTLSAYFSHFTFLGSVLLLAICIGYVLWINLQYMNRTFVKKKTDE